MSRLIAVLVAATFIAIQVFAVLAIIAAHESLSAKYSDVVALLFLDALITGLAGMMYLDLRD